MVAGGFGRLVARRPTGRRPPPSTGWTARDVVGHLVDWFPGFLAAGGIDLPAGPAVATTTRSPRGSTTPTPSRRCSSERGDESFTHPYAGTHRLADAVDRFYTADVFMHSWDLARASGQEPRLDEDFAAPAARGHAARSRQMLRDSGQYGAAVPVPDDAPVVDRLMGFIGRDPAWQPGDGGTP